MNVQAFERDGFAVVPDVVEPGGVSELVDALAAIRPGGSALDRGGQVYASRNLLADVPLVGALAGSPAVRNLVVPVLGPGAFVVRGLLFDKTPGANWTVPWHQDLTVAVKARTDAPGFGPWTVKAGVPHVRPPVGVLEQMVTVRVQLDNGDASSGPLRVVPGSHLAGRLGASSTRDWLARVPAVTCLVPRGGALLMRPLLLHASSASDTPGPHHRRVIHLEFAAGPLPDDVEWFEEASREVATP